MLKGKYIKNNKEKKKSEKPHTHTDTDRLQMGFLKPVLVIITFILITYALKVIKREINIYIFDKTN